VKKKSIFITILITIVALSGLFSVSASEGQPPGPGDFPRDRDMPVTQNLGWNSGESSDRFTSTGDGEVSLERFSSTQNPDIRSLNPAVPVGEPGLSYRYVDTFGVSESAYLADTTHLNTPRGLAIDSSNNLYVVEYKGSRALKYSSPVTPEFSIGVAGLHYIEEGKDIFAFPRDIAVDNGDNFWVADNNRVTQYDSSGNFLQVFPDWDDQPWSCQSDNGHFCGARGVEFDSTGKMYVGDRWNYRVQVFTFSGGSPVYHSTIGEPGVQGSDNDHFSRPEQLVVDSSNNVYIADTNNYRIQKCTYSTIWNCSTFHGTGSRGSGANELDYVDGLGIDSGNNIYIADSGNSRIKKCNSAGTCSEIISGLYWPTDVAIDSSGSIFVSDWDDAAIRKYWSSGTHPLLYAGTPFVPYVTDSSRMFYPWGITVADDGSIYVAEKLGNRLLKLDENGNQQWVVGTPGVGGSSNDLLNWPEGNLAIDSIGRIYVPDTDRHRVQIFTSNGTYDGTMGVTGQRGNDNSHFDRPMGVAISPLNGDIYIADHENTRVQIFHSDLSYKATLGTTDVWGTGIYEFDGPTGVAIDSSGNIFVADKYNQRIQKFNSSRVYQSTIGVTDNCDWPFDYLCGPTSVVVDNHNHLFVTEQWDNRVQVYDTDGNYLTSIGGRWGKNSGEFRNPNGIATDKYGNVYVTDSTNHRIQKYSPGVPGWL
jgi:streptogramin lyase